MERWNRILSNAIAHKIKSESLLTKAVRELMRAKGFSEEQCQLFDACFASGSETVVTFNYDGEYADFGLENYGNMTKEEIINYMSKFLMKENVKILTK